MPHTPRILARATTRPTGFACTATAELVAMHRNVVAQDYGRAFAIWERLGPLARYAWRNPIRDYRPRMKEVLKMQGLIAHATVRPPQLGIGDDERMELRRLATLAGLLESTPPASGMAA